MWQVNYAEAYCSLDTSLPKKSFEAKSNQVLYRKLDIWDYEREWRCILDKERLGDSQFMNIEGGLNSVILGCNISSSDKNELLAICKEKNIPVYATRLNHRSYVLDVEQLL